MTYKEYMALPFEERFDIFSGSMGYDTSVKKDTGVPINSVKVEPYFPEPEVVDRREAFNRAWEAEQSNAN